MVRITTSTPIQNGAPNPERTPTAASGQSIHFSTFIAKSPRSKGAEESFQRLCVSAPPAFDIYRGKKYSPPSARFFTKNGFIQFDPRRSPCHP